MSREICKLISTGFYSGLSPKAPGTIGTIASMQILIAWTWGYSSVYGYSQILMPLWFVVFVSVSGLLATACYLRSPAFSKSRAQRCETKPQGVGELASTETLEVSSCDSLNHRRCPEATYRGEKSVYNKIDPQEVVIDEFAGYYLALLGLDICSVFNVLSAFVLFRFFDITKLGPIRRAERLSGAWGIMADDIVAGVAANISLRLVRYLLF